jgi:DNA polymerase-3 subunit gamma/tau
VLLEPGEVVRNAELSLKEPDQRPYSTQSSTTGKSADTSTDTQTSGQVKRRMHSMASLMGGNQEQTVVSESEIKKTDLPAESFTLEQVKNALELFAADLKKKDKISLSTSISGAVLELVGLELTLGVDSKVQMEQIIEISQDLHTNIRQQIRNEGLQIQVILNEEVQQKGLYTAREKYEHMVQKNPALATFKSKLDLDIEL